MNVKRYKRTGCSEPDCCCGGDMEHDPDGDWVSFADYSAVVMSSPKSVSVPAVAGGGEDAWLCDRLEAQLKGQNLEGGSHREDVVRAIERIRAAIAATKAKEESPWKPKLNS